MKEMIARGLSHFPRTRNGKRDKDAFPLGFFRK
jgi:hypothetical protein